MDEDERRDLTSRLFALLTTKLEDAAALAAEGQGRSGSQERLISLANQVRGGAEEAALIAEVSGFLVTDRARH